MVRHNRCGIYVIEQAEAGRFYIGSSADIERRWYVHRALLNAGKHHAPRLQRAWTKYGAEAFTFSVLEECAKDDLLVQEQAYLDVLKPVFNTATIAGRPPGWSSWSQASQESFRKAQREKAGLITHCPKGHPYDKSNTYRNNEGYRRCRLCRTLQMSGIYAVESPEQREARRAAVKTHYETNKPRIAAQMHEYGAARKEEKRAYDVARKAIANEQRRARHAAETPEQRAERLSKRREQEKRRA